MKKGKTAVIVGAQWGDEGKGKIVDVLSENFSVVARYAGGHNAGHTVIINGKKFILQLVPCGVLRPGCRSVIGNGVVLDPIAFLKEVAALRETGVQGGWQPVRQQPRPRDPALPSHDRTGFGKCSGTGEDRHHLPRHRADLRRQDGPAWPARGGPARPEAAADAHRKRLPRKEHDRARVVQLRAARSGQDVSGICRSLGQSRSLRVRHGRAAESGAG